ncbi:glycosyltransferase family 4 protein [Flavobacterium sp.]
MKKILYIGNKLSSHGNTVTSIETLGLFLEIEGYKVYYASSKNNIFIRMIHMIFKTIKHSKEIDYVLIDTYSTLNFWYAVIISQLCRLLNMKYIAKLHGGDLPKRLENSKVLCKLVFKNAYINIAPSDYLYNAFSEKGFTNIKYIPNTIEIDKYLFSNKQLDFPRLLWVRSFAKIYNPLLAVKVLIKVKEKYPNAILCMIGPKKDDSYDETIQFAKDNNVEVLITGKLAKEEWVALSVNYNVFINTTHYDNTPVSVIEAMALGFPVVSTNVGGIPYLIENNKTGFLVDDNDVAGMVKNVENIFKDVQTTNFVIANAHELVKKFDWEIIKKEWIQLLK